MQKYRPRVHVQWTNDLVTPVEQQIDLRRSLTFSFRETEFITVTAYQNQEVGALSFNLAGLRQSGDLGVI